MEKNLTTKQVFKLKGRTVIVILIMTLLVSPMLVDVESSDNLRDYYFLEIISFIMFQLSAALLLVLAVKISKVDVKYLWRGFEQKHISGALQLTTFSLFFAIAAMYALFYPLSLFFPDFVEVWLIEAPEIVYWVDGEYPLLLNALSFISIVILAPVLEEFIFRGLLLRRWSEKWNMTKAMIISSLIFGLLHGDPIGAFVFGMFMCFIYLRCRSLWLPIICHALNNFIAWALTVGYKVVEGPEYKYSLDDFQSEWPIAVASAAIVVFWVGLYSMRTSKSK